MKINCPICDTVSFSSRKNYIHHMSNVHKAYLHHHHSKSKKEFEQKLASDPSSSKTQIKVPTKETILNKIKFSSTQSSVPLLKLNPSDAIRFIRTRTNVKIQLLPDMPAMNFKGFWCDI